MKGMTNLQAALEFLHSEFCERSKDSSWLMLPMDDGILPDKALFDKLRTRSSFQSINSSGIGPSKWLDEKSMDVKIVKILTNSIF